jgi:hypothetical protein
VSATAVQARINLLLSRTYSREWRFVISFLRGDSRRRVAVSGGDLGHAVERFGMGDHTGAADGTIWLL